MNGEFEVDFMLDPFEYTEDVNIMLRTPGSIYNPGTMESAPLLFVAGEGDISHYH
ncbi:hypothetical protein ACT7DJ_37435 [Bacillus cereus]